MTNYSKFKDFVESINWCELRCESSIPSEVRYLDPRITLDSITEEQFLSQDFLKFKTLADDVTYIYVEDIDDVHYYDYDYEPEIQKYFILVSMMLH